MIGGQFQSWNECNLPNLIAADKDLSSVKCAIMYFEGFVRNPLVFHSLAVLLDMCQTRQSLGFCVKYYFWRFDWLKQFGWFMYTLMPDVFWLRLTWIDHKRYPREAYNMPLNLQRQNYNTWACSIWNVLYKFGFGVVWEMQGVGDIKSFIKRV